MHRSLRSSSLLEEPVSTEPPTEPRGWRAAPKAPGCVPSSGHRLCPLPAAAGLLVQRRTGNQTPVGWWGTAERAFPSQGSRRPGTCRATSDGRGTRVHRRLLALPDLRRFLSERELTAVALCKQKSLLRAALVGEIPALPRALLCRDVCLPPADALISALCWLILLQILFILQ